MEPDRRGAVDTDPEAEDALHAALRRLAPGERLLLMGSLIDGAEALVAAGLRQREPDLDDAAVADRLAELRLGVELWSIVRAERARRGM